MTGRKGERKPRPPRVVVEDVPWCGRCDRRTRLLDEDAPRRCPDCHKLAGTPTLNDAAEVCGRCGQLGHAAGWCPFGSGGVGLDDEARARLSAAGADMARRYVVELREIRAARGAPAPVLRERDPAALARAQVRESRAMAGRGELGNGDRPGAGVILPGRVEHDDDEDGPPWPDDDAPPPDPPDDDWPPPPAPDAPADEVGGDGFPF